MHIKQDIRRNFARRALTYDRAAQVQRYMAWGLLALSREAVSRASRILEVGCGTGYLTEELCRLNPAAKIVAVDLDKSPIQAARRRLKNGRQISWLVADAESLRPDRFDLIISNSVFQWFNKPAATLECYNRSLTPGGSLAFAAMGPGTFQELASSWRRAAGGMNLPKCPELAACSFLGPSKWAAILQQTGFQNIRLSQERLTLTFDSVRDFLLALRDTGATNPRPRAVSPRLFRAMLAAYQEGFGVNGGAIPVSYDLIFALARK